MKGLIWDLGWEISHEETQDIATGRNRYALEMSAHKVLQGRWMCGQQVFIILVTKKVSVKAGIWWDLNLRCCTRCNNGWYVWPLRFIIQNPWKEMKASFPIPGGKSSIAVSKLRGNRRMFWSDADIRCIDCGTDTRLYIFIRAHWAGHLKSWNFILFMTYNSTKSDKWKKNY